MINKKYLISLTLLLLVLMIIPMSFASDNSQDMDILAINGDDIIAVDDSSDILNADEKNIYVAKNGSDSNQGTQDSPYQTIEHALEQASGTTNIYINEGTYNEYAMSIKSNVNIIGLGNAVIDADGGGPIFNEITYDNIVISLNNLTIKNANTSDYGGVLKIRGYQPLIKSDVTFDGVTFINCYSKYSGAVIYDHGGSQANPFNNLTIINCKFIGCSSPAGPVIYARGNTNIINSTFRENKYLGNTYSGSCVGIYGYASANITACIFEDNYADSKNHESGAVYFSGTNLEEIKVNNNVFINNSNYALSASSLDSGKLVNADNNWFGTNDPDFSALIRNFNVSSYAVLDLSADSEIVDINEKAKIIATYYNNGTDIQNTLIPARNITLSATGGNLKDKKAIFTGEFETEFSSSETGEYTITANVDSQQLTAEVTVRDLANKTAVVGQSKVNYKDVTISVNVAPSTATGNVTFKLNGNDEIIYLNEAKGNITLANVPIGEYDDVLLTYNGDANHISSNTTISFTVSEKYPSTLTANASVSGSDVTINVEINPSNATGIVTFTLNGNDEIIYLNEGKGNITVNNVANNDYEVELTYNGDDDYETSIDTVNFTVLNRIPTELSINPQVINDSVTVYAKVNESLATGNVTFYLKYKNQIINLVDGEGNITIDILTEVNYNITFSYNGDINYEPSNVTVSFKVPDNIKETKLTANASVKNQVVTIDADIDHYTASGNVTFTINGEDKVIDITRSKGSITLENVPYGDYSLLLTYNGDESHYPSNYTLNFSVVYYAYGEVIYVSKTGNDDNNASVNAPLLTVAKAVDIANNYEIVKKIYIFNGVYNDANMTILRSYDIEGESKEKTIIDAQGDSLFEIYGMENNNSFTNITLKNGYNSNGGAILDRGNSLNLTDCIFINNGAGDMGGAVYHYYGEANIINCEFIQNAAVSGGALYVSSYTDLTNIDNSAFDGNIALSGIYAGGAIYNAGAMMINNSKFTSNMAELDKSNGGDGGAIYNANLLAVDNSEFTNNHAHYWGGAIKAGGNTYISNSNFTANSAGSRGGAVHSSGSGSYSAWTTYIDYCNFDSNYIGDIESSYMNVEGGAICAEAPTAIRASNFTNNTARDGGAIFMRSNAKYIENCTFTDNVAENGGAIYDNRTQSLIFNSVFINNKATLGGAVLVSTSPTSPEEGFTNLTSNIYHSNSAVNGGAIYSDAGVASPQELNIKYSEFINNTASGNGSAIFTTNRATVKNNAIIHELKDNNVIFLNPQCEGIVTLEDNWWGVNEPNLAKIIRGIVAPERFAIINLSADPLKIEKNEKSTVTVTLKWNDNTTEGVELIPARDIKLSASMGDLTETEGKLNTTFVSQYSNDVGGVYNIIASVDNEMQMINIAVAGDIPLRTVTYVNASAGDDKFGDGSKESPVKTIARAITITDKNGTIYMTGTFKGIGNTKLGISSSFNNITFIGADDAVIDGEHKNWIFSISDGLFTFVNITFRDSYYAGYGAAIKNQAGYLYVENCTFLSNIAQGSSAIDNTAYLVVINSTFRDNIATIYDGGALSSSFEAYIINSTFINNRAYQNGGAMKNYEEGYLYIEGSEFKDNQATGSSKGSYGGAVYSWSSDLEIYTSNFTDNFAESKGGAVYSSYGNSFYEWFTDIQSSVFENNEANSGNSLFLELVTGNVSYNVFLDESNSVYTQGKNAKLDNNWWGVNDPDFAKLLTGTIKEPSTYAVLNASAEPSEISQGSASKLTYEFFWNDNTQDNISLIPQRSIELASTGGELSDTSGNFTDARFETQFSAEESDIYQITANVDNEVLVINVIVKGGVIIIPDVEVNGNNATINVDLIPDIDANITFDFNGTNYSIPVINGKGNITLTGLDNGNYTINLEFSGDETYPYSNRTVEFTIDNPVAQNATMSVNASVENNNVEISVEMTPADATGNITAAVNGENYAEAIVNGTATINIPDLAEGNYTVLLSYSGDDKYNPLSKEVNVTVEGDKSDIITAQDVTKYYKGPQRFVVNVTDYEGNPLVNKTVLIAINGATYTRTTDANGTASIALGLNSGVYNVTTTVDNQTVESVVTILATVNGTDVVKVFRNATQYYATFLDSEGNYLKDGTTVRFNINGVMYDRQVSGNKGLARLNINLEQGEYVITAINPQTGENAANNITVIPRIVENSDIVKYYRNATQYTVKLIGDDGNPVGANVTVRFNINGVFYERQTNESGIARLNINLEPGDYIITAEYEGCMVSNNITVLPVLNATDLTKTYGTSDQFVATLVDGQGNPFADEKIEFNINGVFYYRTTDSSGQARLNINLMPGEYIITSSYNGANIANTVTVKA